MRGGDATIHSMSERHRNQLSPDSTTLFVVDVQERFRTAILDYESMLDGCLRLVRTFRLLERPILITEQYPRGLGQTVSELREALSGEGDSGSWSVPEKSTFSCIGAPGIPDALKAASTTHVLVCGIEAHVCVSQTVHDLLALGYQVQVAVDGVSSRRAMDEDVALTRMERSGALLTTTEAAAFELLVDANHPQFKPVQALYK